MHERHKTSFFLSIYIRIKNIKRKDFLISLLFSLSVLWWTHPDNTIIYGIDSFSFFLHPFNPNFSPLYLYQTSGGFITWAPVSSYIFYISTLSKIFSQFLTPPYVERVFFILFVFLESFGMFRLFSTINTLNNDKADNNLLGKILATTFYLFNPFTLTVTLWHFEQWSFPLILLPFWISVILEIIYAKKLNWARFFETVGLSIFLAPALSGEYAPMWLYIILMTLVLVIIKGLRDRLSWNETIKKSSTIILLGALTLLWTNIPAYIDQFLLNRSTNLTVANNISIFNSTLSYTSIQRVLGGLTVSPWIKIYPETYGWTPLFTNFLIFSGYLIIPLFLIGFTFINKTKHLAYFYLLCLPVIIFSMEGVFPFSIINEFLFNLGGPFLVLSESYYFLGEIYILSLSVIIYAIFNSNLRGVIKKPNFVNISLKNKTIPINRKRIHIGSSFAVVLMIILIVSIPLYPIITSSEYQEKNSQIDMFPLSPNLVKVSSFLYSNFTGPEYYLLVLPMSNSSAYYLSFNNSSFGDTHSLFSSLSPYPVIESNQNWYDEQIISFLWSETYSNLVPVFQTLHIKYVLFNPFFSQGSAYTPPGGSTDTMLNFIRQKLIQEVGEPHTFGNIQLFTIPHPIPLIYSLSKMGTINLPTYSNYLQFLSDLGNSTSDLNIPFETFLWDNDSINSKINSSIDIEPFNGISYNASLHNNTFVQLLLNNGNILSVTNNHPNLLGINETKSALFVSAPSIYTSDVNYKNIVNSQKTIIYGPFNNTDNGMIVNLTIDNLDTSTINWNWWGIIVQNGNFTYKVYFNGNTSEKFYNFGEAAYYKCNLYAWNYITPNNFSNFFNGDLDLNLKLNSDSLQLTMIKIAKNSSRIVLPLFYFMPSVANLNPGYNSTLDALIPNSGLSSNLSIKSYLYNIGATITGIKILSLLPYKYIILNSNVSDYYLKGITINYNSQGDATVSIPKGVSNRDVFVIVAFQNSSEWAILNNNLAYSRISLISSANVFEINILSTDFKVILGMNEIVQLANIFLLISILEFLIVFTVRFYYFKFTFRKSS